ncbi:MAG: 2-dehydropantoate 2-reductase, partial [Candidatus Eremiobacteraeota bacterium]|nr:2-dehydropantoate 2-reductase [Candidatus Eremiobacteraeota bacterium]
SFHVRCAASDVTTANGPYDCIVVGLKANQLVENLDAIKRLCHDRTRVVAMQNGIPWWYFQRHGGAHEGLVLQSVDPGGVLARAFDPENVVGCVIYCSTEIESPGVIKHIEGTRYALGRPDGEIDDELQAISAAMTAGGLKAPLEANLRAQIWLKLMGNAALNPISALTRATLAGMLRSPGIEALVREIMEECCAIAGALGVTIPVSIDKRIEGARNVGEHKTSMLQDLERCRAMELDCMTGAVVELGGILGIATPATRHVHELTSLLCEQVSATAR